MNSKWAAPVMALGLLVAASAAMAAIPQARVTGGMVAGEVVDGLSEYKGIPFAAPPVGKLRWKAPQPVKSWSGVKQTIAFGSACMQNEKVAQSQGMKTPVSEDCLYIDVWTPAKSAGEKLPVIAWIYGGGFSGGATSAPLYDGANFARKGVVFVSLSYRVGPFGFLATPDLSKESGHGSGNYGLLDLVAGLKWVQQNIAQFGGDPKKVTILGHSAGGFAVSMLAGSPLARGLFRAAIAESGSNFTPPQDKQWAGTSLRTLNFAERNGAAWLKTLGVSTLAEARALPADKVEAALGPGAPRFWPPLDGYVIKGDQYTMWQQRRFNDTPIIVGDVSDEVGGFGPRKSDPAAFEAMVRRGYGVKADEILATYPHATEAEATRSNTELSSDTTFEWNQITWARLQAAHGRNKAYFYWFDRPSARDPNGSGHGQEVAYVFGNLGVGGRPAPSDEDLAISKQMQGYWVNFAKTLDPNGPGLPEWPAFSGPDPQVLRIGRDPGPASVPNADRLKVLSDYYDWRRGGSKED